MAIFQIFFLKHLIFKIVVFRFYHTTTKLHTLRACLQLPTEQPGIIDGTEQSHMI